MPALLNAQQQAEAELPLQRSELRPGASALRMRSLVLWAAGAVAAFHLAYGFPALSWVIIGYLFCLLQLARAKTSRQAFYFGLAAGIGVAAPQLKCFWTIFGPGAIALWLILAFWVGLFVALARACLARFGTVWGAALIPFLWTGLEYFRSELYYLRFSWLNVGYVFSNTSLLHLYHALGMYGVGFVAMATAALLSRLQPAVVAVPRLRDLSAAQPLPHQDSGALIPQMGDRSSARAFAPRLVLGAMVVLFIVTALILSNPVRPARGPFVAGVQLEFPTDDEVLAALDKLAQLYPQADLLALSEYTFDGPVPQKVEAWCKEHRRYLVVGGKDPAPKGDFYDTAFVIGPSGDIVLRQGKSVPIQFFKDGLPAPQQTLWDSPWGKIGLCVCYDLSYTRVTDRLIRLGAQALVVPTMDVADWGGHQHQLHARVAPVRAAEYGVPIFRLASSGISQIVDAAGRVTASAGFPGLGEMLAGRLAIGSAGSVPLDRWLAWLAVGVTGAVMLWFLVTSRRSSRSHILP